MVGLVMFTRLVQVQNWCQYRACGHSQVSDHSKTTAAHLGSTDTWEFFFFFFFKKYSCMDWACLPALELSLEELSLEL